MKHLFLSLISSVILLLSAASCSDSKSYAELLTEENQVVNAFLCNYRLVDKIPADTVFQIGPDAPYYCIDDEGDVYMQVLDPGTKERPSYNDRVYFRYIRYNLREYVFGGDNVGGGNADNMNAATTYFLFGNSYVESSTQYGSGIQIPMALLGYNAKVNLVIKSQAGPSADMSYVVPYLYTISYFKSVI